MNRSVLRGKKLDLDCYKAKTTTNECGLDDERVFCSGLNDTSTECALEKCLECGACVGNATCEAKTKKEYVETCSTCKHAALFHSEYPCAACEQWGMWEKGRGNY